ncbi:MAG: hypothetical protein JJT76_08580 [Clostridiaceae bacterium]|nr:hypothetical protein [Clostridiaceae bacterium]
MNQIRHTLFNKKTLFALIIFAMLLLWLFVSTPAGLIYLAGTATKIEIRGPSIDGKVIIEDKTTIRRFLNLADDAVHNYENYDGFGYLEARQYRVDGGENWYLVLLRRTFPFKDV